MTLLLKVMSYQLDKWMDIIDVRLDRVTTPLIGSDLWIIHDNGAFLNKSGEWIVKQKSFFQSVQFYSEFSWESAEDALAFWNAGKYKSRFDHYREKIDGL